MYLVDPNFKSASAVSELNWYFPKSMSYFNAKGTNAGSISVKESKAFLNNRYCFQLSPIVLTGGRGRSWGKFPRAFSICASAKHLPSCSKISQKYF